MFNKDTNYDARLRNIKRNKIIAAIVSSVIGLVLLFWPKASLFFICRFIAIMILISAITTIGVYLGQRRIDRVAASRPTLVSGIILALLGIWLLVSPQNLAAMIPTIVGIIVIVDGFANLGEAIVLKRQFGKFPILPLILAIITVLFGLILIFKPIGVAAIITEVIGIATLYNGISDLIIALQIKPNNVNQAE